MKKGIDTETLAGRYASVRFAAALTKKAFAESLGVHPVVSGDIELGKREPSRDVLVRLASVYGVDINWLLTGKRVSDSDFPFPSDPGNQPSADTGPAALGNEETVFVPFVDLEAAAGAGAEIADWAEVSTIPVPRSFVAPRKGERIRAVSVRGDSMTGIGLDDGDIVLFAPEERSGDGVHVISIGRSLLVKRIHFDPAGRRVRVISENPRYPERTLEGPELEEFRVEGRVVGWLHRY